MCFSLTTKIPIVEKNLSKFKIDQKELNSRRYFIEATRDEVKSMKEKMSLNRNRDKDITANQPLLDNNNQTFGGSSTFNDNCNNLITNNCINNNITSCDTNTASSFTVSEWNRMLSQSKFSRHGMAVCVHHKLNDQLIEIQVHLIDYFFIHSIWFRQRLWAQWPDTVEPNTPNWRIHWIVQDIMELQRSTVHRIDFSVKVYQYNSECCKGKTSNSTWLVIRLAHWRLSHDK